MSDALKTLTDAQYIEDFRDELFRVFVSGSEEDRRAIHEALCSGKLKSPRHFHDPEPTYKWDTNTPDKLRSELLLFGNLEPSDDYRDTLRSIAWYYHTAELLNLDGDTVLRNIATFAVPAKAKLFRSFANRPPEDKSLNAFSMKIITNKNGTYIE